MLFPIHIPLIDVSVVELYLALLPVALTIAACCVVAELRRAHDASRRRLVKQVERRINRL
jgi:hypothetical protein